MNNKSDTFSNEELLELKKELRSSYFTALAGFLIVMVVLHLLIYIRFDSFEKLQFEILVITGTMIFTFFVTKHSTRQLRSEIRDGRKIIVFKKIEEKSDFMDKQDRFSPEFKKYVILASGQKYVVTEEQYQKAEVSDYVAVHMTPLRESTIRIEIIKENLPLTNAIAIAGMRVR